MVLVAGMTDLRGSASGTGPALAPSHRNQRHGGGKQWKGGSTVGQGPAAATLSWHQLDRGGQLLFQSQSHLTEFWQATKSFMGSPTP